MSTAFRARPTARGVLVHTQYRGRVLSAVLPAGHPDRPRDAGEAPTWRSPSVALTGAALAAGALAAGAGLALLGGTAALLGSVALTLLIGALWVQAAAAAPRQAPARATPAAYPASWDRPMRRTTGRPSALPCTATVTTAVTTAAVVAAVALAPAAADAQRNPESLARLSVAAGIDARGAVAGQGGGRTLLLGYDVWQGSDALPVTVRATGTFLDRVGDASSPSRFGGVGLDAALPIYNAGPVHPYLVAGVGVYHLRGIPGGPNAAAEPARTTPAVLGGAGVRMPLGAASAFVEGRYTTFRGAVGGGYTPLVIGLRFGR